MSWKLAPGVSFVEADGGAVLLDGEKGTYWQLNRTGSIILRTLIDTGSTEAVVEELKSFFPESRADYERDVRTLANKVQSYGLVKYES